MALASGKSSKDAFQQFRKAALEKERVKALKKQVEGNEKRLLSPRKPWYSENLFNIPHQLHEEAFKR